MFSRFALKLLLLLGLVVGCKGPPTIEPGVWPVPVSLCPDSEDGQQIQSIRATIAGERLYLYWASTAEISCASAQRLPSPGPEGELGHYVSWTDDGGETFAPPQLLYSTDTSVPPSRALVPDGDEGAWALVPIEVVDFARYRWALVHIQPDQGDWVDPLVLLEPERLNPSSPPFGTILLDTQDSPTVLLARDDSGRGIWLATQANAYSFEKVEHAEAHPEPWLGTCCLAANSPWTGDLDTTFRPADGVVGRYWVRDDVLELGSLFPPFDESSIDHEVPTEPRIHLGGLGEHTSILFLGGAAWPRERQLLSLQPGEERMFITLPEEDSLGGTTTYSLGSTKTGTAWLTGVSDSAVEVGRLSADGVGEFARWQLPAALPPPRTGRSFALLDDGGRLHYVDTEEGVYGSALPSFAPL